MPIDLATLIKAAPFEDQDRQNLLAGIEKMTEEEKFFLSQTCWSASAQQYFSQSAYERDKLLLEIRQGKRKFNKKDFDDVREKLIKEYTDKLSSAQSEASIEEVRDELKKYLRPGQPIPQNSNPAVVNQ